MVHRPRRKLFFPAGLIALVIFPVMGFQRIAQTYTERYPVLYTMEINWTCSKPDCYYKYSAKYITQKRIFSSFILSDDSVTNHHVLNSARTVLNRIKKNKDTAHGVRIVFSNSTKYEDFIKTTEYCREKFPSIFAPAGNAMWAFYEPMDTTNIPMRIKNEWRRKGHL